MNVFSKRVSIPIVTFIVYDQLIFVFLLYLVKCINVVSNVIYFIQDFWYKSMLIDGLVKL